MSKTIDRVQGRDIEPLILPDLAQIIELSDLRGRAKLPHKGTIPEVVNFRGRRYKVRKYPDPNRAESQRLMMNQVADLFIHCYGRLDEFLVLEFIEGEAIETSPHTLREMGFLLSRLSRMNGLDPPANTFSSWCEDLENGGIFTRSTIARIREYYTNYIAAHSVDWCLEYYDAMPRNFMLRDFRTMISIDEKHLQVGPLGLCLVKSEIQLSAAEFEDVKKAYCSSIQRVDFDDPEYKDFLYFYYLVYGLAFNARCRKKELNKRVYEFHWRRRKLLQIINAPNKLRFREEAIWRSHYRVYKLWSNIARLGVGVKRRLLKKVLPSDFLLG